MTLAVMAAFGVDIETTGGDSPRFRIPAGSGEPKYRGRVYQVEPDASAASYFFAAAAVTEEK